LTIYAILSTKSRASTITEPPTPDSVEQLQTRLEEALESEKYEEAAKLRDEMKKLKQGGN
jgi:protein-arginine kinase activator protein McsA